MNHFIFYKKNIVDIFFHIWRFFFIETLNLFTMYSIFLFS